MPVVGRLGSFTLYGLLSTFGPKKSLQTRELCHLQFFRKARPIPRVQMSRMSSFESMLR